MQLGSLDKVLCPALAGFNNSMSLTYISLDYQFAAKVELIAKIT